MKSIKPFFKIIDEICIEKNIEQKWLSYGWIRELKKDNKSHYIMNYQFDLNSNVSCKIANDKFATYEVLYSNNIPTIEHRIIFNPKTRSAFYKNKFIEEIKELLEKNEKIVIKANDSCKGKDVYLCTTQNDIENIVKKLFDENKDSLSACPYLEIDYEYRVIYLCDEIVYIYKKKKPYVIGNGKDTLEKLISQKKSDCKIDLIKELDFDYVPKNGEEITISWKHNLSSGAEPIIVDEYDENIFNIKQIALNAARCMNINFASVDIALTKSKEILVMEVNGSVCMNKFSEVIPDGFNIAKNIYSKAVDKMFQ